MNRVYRVIWCHIRNTYVVASELASRKKVKGAKATVTKKKGTFLFASLLGFSLIQGVAFSDQFNDSDVVNLEQEGEVKEEEQEVLEEEDTDLTLGDVDDTFSLSSSSGLREFSNGVVLGNGANNAGGESAVAIGHNATSLKAGAIAIGNGATTEELNGIALGANSLAVGQNSVALGSGAEASSHNSVAIGAGSVADSEGIVSVGSRGNERIIKYVRNGEIAGRSTEAINGGQLYASMSSIQRAIGGEMAFNEHGILGSPNFRDALKKLNVQDDVTSVYDGFEHVAGKIAELEEKPGGLFVLEDDGKTIGIDNVQATDAEVLDFSHGNKTRKLTGVGNGEIGKESKDAINGSQLYATNKSISDALGGNSTIDDDGNITAPSYNFNKDGEEDSSKVFDNVGDALTNIDQRVETNTTNITNNTTVINDIKEGKTGLVKLNGTEIVIDEDLAKDAYVFNIHNGAEARKLTGVADGKVSEKSVDAINGSQLYATNKSIADALGGGSDIDADGNIIGPKYEITNKEGDKVIVNNVGDAITNIEGNIYNISNGKAGLIKIDGEQIVIDNDLAKDAKVFNIANDEIARKLTGVDKGEVVADSTDAINGGQLYATNKSISEALGGGSEVNPDGTITPPEYELTNEDGSKITINNVGGAITNLDERVYNNTQNINNITQGTAGLIKLKDNEIVIDNILAKNAQIFNISNNGQSRTLTGISAGAVNGDSKDAINGSQLHAANESIADALGGNASVNEDGTIKNPTYNLVQAGGDGSKADFNNVGDALTNIDDRVTDLDKDVKDLDNKVTNLGDKVTNIDNTVNNIQNGTSGLVQLGKDQDGNAQIQIDNDLAGSADKFDISNGDDGRVLTGVEKGEVSKDSTDAVNGSQLYGSMDNLAGILGKDVTVDENGYVSVGDSFDVGQGPTDLTISGALHHLKDQISSSGGNGLFEYDSDKNQIILAEKNGINKDTQLNMGDRVITGVQAGRVEQGSMDAINGSQLWETNQKVDYNTQQINHINNTLNHYNTRINNIERTVHQNRKVASAGISSAMAMSSIPYVEHMKYSFGMGVASYDGEAAMSMGMSFKIGSDARFKIQGSYDTQNKAGVGVGIAFGF